MPRDFPLAGVVERPVTAGEPALVVTPRDAATVMLVRDRAERGVEVFMLRRAATMAFAPSMWVFPGGGVDPRDVGADLLWAGPEASEWARRLGRSEEVAVALVCAAVRELFEECGVLLASVAGPVRGSTGTDREPGDLPSADELATPEWQADRERLVRRELSFAELCRRRRLTLRGDLLAPHTRWVTPQAEVRRYDTTFFVARLPRGQEADGCTSEAVEARWVAPAGWLREVEAQEAEGAALLLPPTRTCLEDVADARDVSELHARSLAVTAGGGGLPPVLPVVLDVDGRRVVRAPLERARGHR